MIEASPIQILLCQVFFSCVCLRAVDRRWFDPTESKFQRPYFFAVLFFVTLGLLFVYLFSWISDRIRRVAVSKNKIVVIEGTRNVRFDWPEVKSLKIVPYLNLYKLKIRGKKAIYFFPSQNIDPAFGIICKDTSRMGDIVEKRKKEFGFK